MNLKKIVFPLLSIAIGLGIFSVVIGFAGIENILEVFKSTSLFYLFLFFVVTTLIMLLSVYRWKIVLMSYGYKVSFMKLLSYDFIGYAVSYLTPTARTGGVPLRAYFLKKQNVPLAEGLSSVAVDKSMELIVNFLFAVFAVLIFIFPLNIPSGFKIVSITFSLVILGLVLLFFFRLYFKKGFFSTAFKLINFIPQFELMKKLRRKARKLELYVHFFLRYRWKSFLICSLISVFIFVLMVLESKFGLLAIGYDAKIAYVFLIMAAIAVAGLIPIPATLGVLEVSEASVFLMLGINPYIGIALALIVRAKECLWTALVLVLLSNTGIKLFNLLINNRKNKYGARTHS
jgi:uncharacterized protein (TIRG00374 family)